MHAVRALLLESGAHMVAPCPHDQACPMLATGDWCHFAARLERTAAHRRLKSGLLGYEDEKFSYLAVSRNSGRLPAARVLAPPRAGSGKVELKLCESDGGAKIRLFTRRGGSDFKRARRLIWGDRR